MEIRPAGPSDTGAIAALVYRAYAHYVGRIGQRPGPMDDDHPADIAAGHTYLAVDGSPAGVIVIHPHSDHLLIRNVAVAPERQGEGIGGTLLEFAADRAGELALPELRLYTHEKMAENRALYEHLGWEQYEPPGESGARIHLRKSLSP